jgi:hypothetical protein
LSGVLGVMVLSRTRILPTSRMLLLNRLVSMLAPTLRLPPAWSSRANSAWQQQQQQQQQTALQHEAARCAAVLLCSTYLYSKQQKPC